MMRGCTLAAFSFEKISPPARREPVPATSDGKRRGIIVQLFGRFAEARIQRKTKGTIAESRSKRA
jgi:hypothetical protein